MDPIATVIRWAGALPEGEEAAKGIWRNLKKKLKRVASGQGETPSSY